MDEEAAKSFRQYSHERQKQIERRRQLSFRINTATAVLHDQSYDNFEAEVSRVLFNYGF